MNEPMACQGARRRRTDWTLVLRPPGAPLRNSLVVAVTLLALALAVGLPTVINAAQPSASPSIAVNPATTSPGLTIGVTATGFPRNTSIQISFDTSIVLSGKTDRKGTFQNSFSIPLSTTPGNYAVKGTAKGVSASTSVSVMPPVTLTATATATPVPFTFSPTPVPPTSTVTLVPATPSRTPTRTSTPTVTRSPTRTGTATLTRTGTATPTRTPSPVLTATVTPPRITPVADAYVDAGNASRNFGTDSQLRTDGSAVQSSYVRFDVQGTGGAVSKATLRVYANSDQSMGYDVHRVANTSWTEMTITASNAPPWDAAVLGSSGPIQSGSWTSVDVTALISGDGTYNLALTTNSSTGVSYASRETGGATSPYVTLTLGGTPAAATTTPTPTTVGASPTTTVTPTGTSAPIATLTPTQTATTTPTVTPAPSTTPTGTSAPISTLTPTQTATAAPTVTTAPSNTPTGTSTPMPTPTSTQTATDSPTATTAPSYTPVATFTRTPTLIPTPTATASPTLSATPSRTTTRTSTPTVTLTPTPTVTATPSHTPTTAVASSTTTRTPTPSATIAANTATVTPTRTVTRTATSTATPGVSGAVPSFNHVYVLMMENKEYPSIVGSASAPYLNGLIAQYGLATNYNGVAHPSEPNYLALFSGSTQGVTDDAVYNFSGPNLGDQLEVHGKTWREYSQNRALNCYLGATSSGGEDGTGSYARKHSAPTSFTQITGNASRCANLSDFTHFDAAAADFIQIAPNQCNDMHDCSVAVGDAWLQSWVPSHILNTPAWQNGLNVLFIVWDEGTSGTGGGGHVANVVISNDLVSGGFKSATPHNHYSLLRTIEDAWSLGCLGSSCQANNLGEFFR
jgi:hypothetical protein